MKELLESKNLVINSIFLKSISDLNLDLKEFLFIVYFINDTEKLFDVKRISQTIMLSESDVLSAFNSLIKKKIILIESKKNNNSKISEYVKLDYLYKEIAEAQKKIKKSDEVTNIYTAFESEFARPISSIEYEIIKAWQEKEFSEEMILGALKEAVYNGVHNLRYIDKILYEWQKKGFKSMEDVNAHITKRNKDKESKKDLFDYNWLDEENNE